MAEKILIDQYCEYDGEIINNEILYTCTLNQTDINNNKNKFYIIQLLKTKNNSFNIFIRYGRIGEKGIISNKQFSSLLEGMQIFHKQFKQKTGNTWSKNIYKTFQQKPNKYFLTTIDINDIDIPKIVSVKKSDSILNPRVQFLIKLISDKTMMEKSLINLNINIKKMPLGKISKTQIIKAKEIINIINSSLINPDFDKLTELSSQFYTLIPYSLGRRKPPVIDNITIIAKYIDLLNELEQINASVSIIDNSQNDSDINPIDTIYNDLNTIIEPLDKNGKMWQIINEYVKIADTHNYNVDVIDIYKITKNGEKEIFTDYCKNIDNHMLLWHGSGLSNWCSILKNGFRLPHRGNACSFAASDLQIL